MLSCSLLGSVGGLRMMTLWISVLISGVALGILVLSLVPWYGSQSVLSAKDYIVHAHSVWEFSHVH